LKKIILGLFVLTTLLIAEDEYNLGIKNVQAKDKRQYDSTVKLKVNDNKEEKEMIGKLNIKDKKLDLFKDLGIKKIKIRKEIIPELSLNYDIKIYSAQKKSNVIIEEKTDKGENHLIFGLGGYDKIDSFKYILDYKKEEEKDLTYFLHIGRNIRGEDRKNDGQSIDNYYGKLWYKNIDLALSHILTDEEFPGKESTPVKDSYKKGKETSINLNYNIKNEKDVNVNVNANLNKIDVTSDNDKRAYKNDFFEIVGVYEKDNYILKKTENYTELNLNYHNEKLGTEKINSIQLYGKNHMKLKENKKWNFDMGIGTEIINGDKNENNFMIKLKADKEINEKMNLSFGIEKNDFQKSSKELINSFEFDNDILPFKLSQLENEKNLKSKISLFYNEKKYYMEGSITNINSENKIIYKQNKTEILNEIPIELDNKAEKLNWQELELKGSYTYNDNYRGEIKYIYKTLDEINFSPQNRINLNLIYNNKNYKLNLEGMYYSKMYSDILLKNKLDGYKIINLYNSYQFSETLNLNLKFLNLLNANAEKKEEYSIFSRKILLEFKINY